VGRKNVYLPEEIHESDVYPILRELEGYISRKSIDYLNHSEADNFSNINEVERSLNSVIDAWRKYHTARMVELNQNLERIRAMDIPRKAGSGNEAPSSAPQGEILGVPKNAHS